jgi:hypothetical protein
METYTLTIRLESETTFGRGDGLAGMVDQEVVHDTYGFPYLRGRTIKGLLSEECDGIAALLDSPQRWNAALRRLFGVAGSTGDAQGLWHYGDATLPAELRAAVAIQQDPNLPVDMRLSAAEVLDALTAIRSQTAIDASTGAPDEGSLRAARVVIRDLVFTSALTVPETHEDDLTLLAAGCLALRHLGSGRTRGRGRVRCTLQDPQGTDITLARIDRLEEVKR